METPVAFDREIIQELIGVIARFVEEKLRPIEAEVAENDAVPEAIIAQMKELGLYGLTIPAEYGGLDLSMEAECWAAPALRFVPALAPMLGLALKALFCLEPTPKSKNTCHGLLQGSL
jgi:acyl-CoA dehydrogenase